MRGPCALTNGNVQGCGTPQRTCTAAGMPAAATHLARTPCGRQADGKLRRSVPAKCASHNIHRGVDWPRESRSEACHGARATHEHADVLIRGIMGRMAHGARQAAKKEERRANDNSGDNSIRVAWVRDGHIGFAKCLCSEVLPRRSRSPLTK